MAVSQSFAEIVAQRIGAPVARVKSILDQWEPFEGVSSTAHNPLATTQSHAGATGNYNSTGVKNYSTDEVGADATAQTLLNGRYDAILAWMRDGTLDAPTVAKQLRTWGTSGFAAQVEGGKIETLAGAANTAGEGAPQPGVDFPGSPPPPGKISSLRPAAAPTDEDVRNPNANPATLKSAVLNAQYDAQNELAKWQAEHSLVQEKGLWGNYRVMTEGDLDPQSKTPDVPLPSGKTVFVEDKWANGLAAKADAAESIRKRFDELFKVNYYTGGDAAGREYISNMDLAELNRQRTDNQWKDAVLRWSNIDDLISEELAQNQRGEAANRANQAAMYNGDVSWGQFGQYTPTSMQDSYGPQAQQLLSQQGYGQVGQGALSSLPPLGQQDFNPSGITVPQGRSSELPHYAMGTPETSLRNWPIPAPPNTPPGVIGVPKGLWSLGRTA